MEEIESIGYNQIQGMATYWDLLTLSSSTQYPIGESTPPFLSSHNNMMNMNNIIVDGSTTTMDYSYSSGYLQDALLEFTSKRRRLNFSLDDDHHHSFHPHHPHNLSNSDYSMNFHENYDYFTQMMTKSHSISGEEISRRRSDEEGSIIFPESSILKSKSETYEIEASAATCSSSFNNGLLKEDKDILHFPSFPPGNYIGEQQKRKKKATLMTSKVVYPFALVKPGGAEGDVTLNDINRRILMPPTRPVRHPVGEYACRPIVSSSDGPGLSGKEVVTLTRIRTHGRGTITIIRTKN